MYTAWTEGGFLELDATWMEDIVFDDVNDYYNFIRGGGSPFTQAQVSLGGGAASYEDCNWQHYQTESFGNAIMRSFWERRRSVQIEPVMTTYSENLAAAGVAFEDAWGEYAAWNFASGTRAAASYGYGEAARYPAPPATFIYSSLPVATTTGGVAPLAANACLVDNPDGALSGIPEFSFTSLSSPSVVWSVSVLLSSRTGAVTRVPMILDGGSGTLLLSGYDWADLSWAALVIGNATIGAGLAFPYSFSARAVAPILIDYPRAWSTTSTTSPYPIRARVKGGTSAPDPSSVTLTYRVNGGAPVAVPMTATGTPDEYRADIPAQPVGSTIEYRVAAQSIAGDPASSPALPGAFHAFEVVTVFEPFETSGGWTVGDAGDDATSGVWERAQPAGTSAAPGADFTSAPGASCFVTQKGVAGGVPGAADVDGGKTTLISPVFDLSSGGAPYQRVTARYRRWYSNDLGGWTDDAWRADVSNDGGTSWTNVETVTLGENTWVPVAVDLLAVVGVPGRLRFRFVPEDAGNGSVVEAAVDDFEIIAVLQNPVAVGGSGGAPAAIRLGPAVPNPSRSAISMQLVLPSAAPVAAAVRDLQGRLTRRLIPEGTRLPAGSAAVVWDGVMERGRTAPAGLYFVEVTVGSRRLERRIVLLR